MADAPATAGDAVDSRSSEPVDVHDEPESGSAESIEELRAMRAAQQAQLASSDTAFLKVLEFGAESKYYIERRVAEASDVILQNPMQWPFVKRRWRRMRRHLYRLKNSVQDALAGGDDTSKPTPHSASDTSRTEHPDGVTTITKIQFLEAQLADLRSLMQEQSELLRRQVDGRSAAAPASGGSPVESASAADEGSASQASATSAAAAFDAAALAASTTAAMKNAVAAAAAAASARELGAPPAPPCGAGAGQATPSANPRSSSVSVAPVPRARPSMVDILKESSNLQLRKVGPVDTSVDAMRRRAQQREAEEAAQSTGLADVLRTALESKFGASSRMSIGSETSDDEFVSPASTSTDLYNQGAGANRTPEHVPRLPPPPSVPQSSDSTAEDATSTPSQSDADATGEHRNRRRSAGGAGLPPLSPAPTPTRRRVARRLVQPSSAEPSEINSGGSGGIAVAPSRGKLLGEIRGFSSAKLRRAASDEASASDGAAESKDTPAAVSVDRSALLKDIRGGAASLRKTPSKGRTESGMNPTADVTPRRPAGKAPSFLADIAGGAAKLRKTPSHTASADGEAAASPAPAPAARAPGGLLAEIAGGRSRLRRTPVKTAPKKAATPDASGPLTPAMLRNVKLRRHTATAATKENTTHP